MARKNSNRVTPKELKKSVSTILVANNKDFRPYIEIFEFTGENITQQQLGTLLGIFEIRDNNEDSAYIVNFLTSVAKKEYFINPKRSAAESFEAALHKVNLALSELANHGNVNWIGKLDAAVCLIERNYIHFSVTGNARVLLLRNQAFTDISESLGSDELDNHPIKTFVDISSGKVELGDKIIITGENLLQVFSLTEIKKGAIRFDKEKFVQFIKTALINELDIAGTIIVDAHEDDQKEEELKEEPERKKKKQTINAFSEKTYRESITKTLKPEPPKSSEDKKNEKKKDEAEYVDKKTGHIYVQGEYKKEGDTLFNYYLHLTKEKLADFSFWIKTKSEKIISDAKNSLIDVKDKIKESKIKKEEVTEVRQEAEKEDATIKNVNVQKIEVVSGIQQMINKIFSQSKRILPTISFRKLLPNFSKIKFELEQMNYQQKVYTVIALALIFIVPLIWIRFQSNREKITNEQVVEEPLAINAFTEDKNIILDTKVDILFTRNNLGKSEISNNTSYAISGSSIIEVENNQKSEEFNLQSDWGEVRNSASMDDLEMIFILTSQNKVISFSSISNKFQEDTIVIPSDIKIGGMATYLTYLYVLDSINNQVYRYPRAEGGFGEKTNWINEDVNLENVTDMAIDENIYFVDGQQIIKLFQGKREAFNIEQSATPIKFNLIYANDELENIYVLDSENGRIVKYAKDGTIISQYQNDAIKDAVDFSINEEKNKAYFTTLNKLMSLNL